MDGLVIKDINLVNISSCGIIFGVLLLSTPSRSRGLKS